MNKIKITILLLVSAVLLLFSSCGGMMVEDTDNVNIDLSSVLSKAAGDDEYVRIWLFPVGTVSPYDLGEEAYQKVNADGTVTLSNIPVGPVYKIYISLGTRSATDIFTTTKTFNGKVTVTGGTSTQAPITEVKFGERGITPIAAYTGQSVKGAAVAGGTFYTVGAAGNKLFYGSGAAYVAPAAGFTFNSVDAGYKNRTIVSAANAGGEGFVRFNGTTPDYTYADGLATAVENAAINILNADVFWDDAEGVQMTVGHTEGGLILHMFIDDNTADDLAPDINDVSEWIPVDLKPFLDEAGLPLAGQLIKSITVVKKYNASSELDALWVYMVSKAGNFRIQVPVDGTGMNIDEDEILTIFEDFVSDNPAIADREILNITNPQGDKLYIGTDNGLYRATATDAITGMNPTLIAASGSRIKYLASTSAYTACVTPLELLIYRESDKKVARISFNEGLPVTGLLTNGVTGIAWSGSTLYVAGTYGVSTVNAANSTLWQ